MEDPTGQTAAALMLMATAPGKASQAQSKASRTNSSSSTDNRSVSASNKSWALQKLDQHVFPYMLDLYHIVPTYEWNPVTSRFSKVMTVFSISVLVTYAYLSISSFVKVPPQLFQRYTFTLSRTPDVDEFPIPIVAFSIDYSVVDPETGNKTKHYVNWTNEDPYFTFVFEHNTIIDQLQGGMNRTMIPQNHIIPCGRLFENQPGLFCINPQFLQNYKIQGTFIYPKYTYLNFKLKRCIDSTPGGSPCAKEEEVNEAVQSSVQITMNLRTYRPNPTAPEDGPEAHDRSYRWFARPGASLQKEVFMQFGQIEVQDRKSEIGLTEPKQIGIIEFDHMDSYDRPYPVDEQSEYLDVFVRMSTTGRRAEVTYPNGDILALISLLGAFANVVVNFTFGVLTRKVNQKLFHKHFNHTASQLVNSSPCQQPVEAKTVVNCERGQRIIRHRNLMELVAALPLDKMDVRMLDNEMLDRQGRLMVTPEELLHPTTVFGEFRLFFLLEHQRKRKAAAKLCSFYLCHVKGRGRSSLAGRDKQCASFISQVSC